MEMKTKVNIVFNNKHLFSEAECMQIDDEFYPALEFLLNQNLTNVLEIGAAQGYSMFGWMTVCDGFGISVDLPAGHPQGRTIQECECRDRIWRGKFGDRVISVTGDSQAQSTINQVQKILDGEQVDFLFIDADHHYENVKRDYLNYRRFVSPNGIIGFHDINDTPEHRSFDVTVCELWDEIDGVKIEFNTHQHWAGIGFILLGNRHEHV